MAEHEMTSPSVEVQGEAVCGSRGSCCGLVAPSSAALVLTVRLPPDAKPGEVLRTRLPPSANLPEMTFEVPSGACTTVTVRTPLPLCKIDTAVKGGAAEQPTEISHVTAGSVQPALPDRQRRAFQSAFDAFTTICLLALAIIAVAVGLIYGAAWLVTFPLRVPYRAAHAFLDRCWSEQRPVAQLSGWARVQRALLHDILPASLLVSLVAVALPLIGAGALVLLPPIMLVFLPAAELLMAAGAKQAIMRYMFPSLPFSLLYKHVLPAPVGTKLFDSSLRSRPRDTAGRQILRHSQLSRVELREGAMLDGRESAVFAALESAALGPGAVKPVAIFTTHHHWDHAGGNAEMLKRPGFEGMRVYGGKDDSVQACTHWMADGDVVHVGPALAVRAIGGACFHTRGSLMFAIDSPTPALFTGDVAFCGSCGANFEGSVCEVARGHATLWRSCVAQAGRVCADRWLLFPGHEVALPMLHALRESVEDEAGPARSVLTPGGPATCRLEATVEAAGALRRCKPPQPCVPHVLADEVHTNLSFVPLRGAAAELTMAFRQSLLPTSLPADGDGAGGVLGGGEPSGAAAALHVPWTDADGAVALPPAPPDGEGEGRTGGILALCRGLFAREGRYEECVDRESSSSGGGAPTDAAAVFAESPGCLPAATVEAYFAPDEEEAALVEAAVTAAEVKEAFKLVSAFAFVPPHLHIGLVEQLLTCRHLQPAPLDEDEWRQLLCALEPLLTRERAIGPDRFCEALRLDKAASRSAAAHAGWCGLGASCGGGGRAGAMRTPPFASSGSELWGAGFRRLFPARACRRAARVAAAGETAAGDGDHEQDQKAQPAGEATRHDAA
ncbi:hypothetical protein EMIHUDRAFT_218459 [Emiliania huxleyi CCMP1516]|uniref:Metallo-beta-lactamase domain-containing protein n=2 Tax=Emiliania huxleyi TaxID=2903 RepID=A0A0D3I8B5_EMIH1|nr:hypothetical protein EMIHUDRAFT_218459 [Emiliania huxleyi CCMP1516]EOD07500.1 hypothetical protein EMIHUDRAFT_218459 [Emiliania huxleyi CCMP1516]|eukprot:XP_005759929.1 hypothetical protein EMIHUDRAFT_218459 [Emiliania huxleyi CCMP1516]